MNEMGLNAGAIRMPLDEPSGKSKEIIKKSLRVAGLLK
jgi:hypothetical protein